MKISSTVKLATNGLILGAVLFLSIEVLQNLVKEIWINYFFKIIILSIFLGIYLNNYKQHLKKGTIFFKGILRGLVLSSIAAATYFGLNFISYAINPEFAIIRQGFVVADYGDFVLINSIYFYEMMVFGVIVSFILLHRMKDKTYIEQY